MAEVKVNTVKRVESITLTLSQQEAAIVTFLLGRNSGWEGEVSRFASNLYNEIVDTLHYGTEVTNVGVAEKDYNAPDAVRVDLDKTEFVVR